MQFTPYIFLYFSKFGNCFAYCPEFARGVGCQNKMQSLYARFLHHLHICNLKTGCSSYKFSQPITGRVAKFSAIYKIGR
jgi:hypothetical protein